MAVIGILVGLIFLASPTSPKAELPQEERRARGVEAPEPIEYPTVSAHEPPERNLDGVFAALGKQGMIGLGPALVAAEAETGVNAVLLAAIIAHESGWGTSALARDKNNMAGLGAYDGREYSAGMAFATREESVMFLARLIARKPCGTLDEIGAWYATDPAWPAKVAACVEKIKGVRE